MVWLLYTSMNLKGKRAIYFLKVAILWIGRSQAIPSTMTNAFIISYHIKTNHMIRLVCDFSLMLCFVLRHFFFMESSSHVYKGLLYGGIASCVGEVATMPVDVIKTRLQLDGAGSQKLYKGPINCATSLLRKGGPPALFKGLSPALLRQSTYGSLRYGLYGPIRNSLGVDPGTPKTEIPIFKKILAGGLSGASASAIANPTDLIKVRLQTDGQIKDLNGRSQPKKYASMLDVFLSIVREEGVCSLWKGVGPTVGRATVLAAAELSTYDEVKGRLLAMSYFEDGLVCTAVTSSISGFVCAIASSPFDVVVGMSRSSHTRTSAHPLVVV